MVSEETEASNQKPMLQEVAKLAPLIHCQQPGQPEKVMNIQAK